jgi:hypothetical protein
MTTYSDIFLVVLLVLVFMSVLNLFFENFLSKLKNMITYFHGMLGFVLILQLHVLIDNTFLLKYDNNLYHILFPTNFVIMILSFLYTTGLTDKINSTISDEHLKILLINLLVIFLIDVCICVEYLFSLLHLFC